METDEIIKLVKNTAFWEHSNEDIVYVSLKQLKKAFDADVNTHIPEPPCKTCENNKEHSKRIRCNKQFRDKQNRELWYMQWCKYSV